MVCAPALLSAGSPAFRSVSDGSGQLLDMTVGSILRDSAGYVWLGNGLGVDRFDGVRLRHYPIAGTDTKYRRVNALASISSRQEIYAGNGDGLWVLAPNEDSFRKVFADSSAAGGVTSVTSLIALADGSLAIGSAAGLFRYAPGAAAAERFPLVDSRRSAPSNRINAMALAGDTLFLATDAGIIVLNDSVPVLYGFDVPLTSVAAGPERVYLGTADRGAYTFDRRTGAMKPFAALGSNVVTDVAVDGRRLFIATDGMGVIEADVRNDSVVSRYTHQPGRASSLGSNAIYDVYVDADGLLWVGYYQLGASYTPYSADIFSTYSAGPYSTGGRAVRVVLKHAPYTLIGTRDGVVIVDDSTTPPRVSHYEVPQLRSNMVISAAWYRGRFLVGTYGGGLQVIYPSDDRVTDVISLEDYPFRRGHVFCITVHPDGSVWVGTSAGLYRYSSDGAQDYRWTSGNSQLPSGNIYAIFFDSKGNGWICTENGLAVYDPTSDAIRGTGFPKGFFNDRKFKDVYEDSRGVLYFLPEHGDVCTTDIEMTSFGPLAPPVGGELEPRALIEDPDGCLWLATSNGIFSSPRGEIDWTEYGSTDGVTSPLFINCTPVSDADGRLWFGNSAGLLTVRPAEVHARSKSNGFPLRPAEVLVNGAPLTQAHISSDSARHYRVDVPCHAASVILRLSPLNYSDPGNLHYQYNLDGENEWHDLDRTFDLPFYGLSGGTHHLLLRQAGRADTLTEIEIHVPYPSWLWICLGATLVAVFSLAVAYGLHVRRMRAEHPAHMSPPLPAEPAVSSGESDEATAAQRKYKTYTMREEEGRDIAARLDRVMSESRPYANPDLRLAELADMIGVSGHRLSFYFSQYLHQSFYDYVNSRRVDEFKRLAAQPDASRFTLSALSAKAGFSSRTSFFRYFKKAEGITPAEYIERLKN